MRRKADMTKKIVYIFFFTLVLADIGYSFFQFYNTPLDRDMSESIVPAYYINPVLESPLGLKIFREKTTYHNPNRFFSHWSLNKYFNTVPLFLQKCFNPIDSVYLSCAIIKIVTQIALIFLLAFAISGTNNVLKLDFILAAALITPLFQTNGFFTYMGIIDQSTSYVFFYALPTSLLLLYFMPFFLKHYYEKEAKEKKIIRLLWIPLAIVICLSGPLNPGIVLVVTFIILLHHLLKTYSSSTHNDIIKIGIDAIRQIPKDYLFYLIPISIFSLYSLFLGTFNSSTINQQIPLIELYGRIPDGLFYQFTSKLGFPVLFTIIIINIVVIKRKFKSKEAKRILNIFKWILLFALVYILLLPLGGHRVYRPNVLRYDTIMPITLSMMFLFGHSTLFLIKNITDKQKILYYPLIIFIAFIFSNSDEKKFDKNNCERMALKQLSETSDKIVKLENDCNVISWTKIENPNDSELNAQMLKILRITKEKTLYYQ